MTAGRKTLQDKIFTFIAHIINPVFDEVENIVVWEKMLISSISPLHTMFSKVSFLGLTLYLICQFQALPIQQQINLRYDVKNMDKSGYNYLIE